MRDRKTRLKWAHKILRARAFVVLTDSESIIALAGLDPGSLHDIEVLHLQLAEIDNFMLSLKELRNEHTQAIDRLMDAAAKKAPRNSKAPVSRRKKVQAKEV